jgi:hypothetical protein
MKWQTKSVVAKGKLTYTITNQNIDNGGLYSSPWVVSPLGKTFFSLKDAKKFCDAINSSASQYYKEKCAKNKKA